MTRGVRNEIRNLVDNKINLYNVLNDRVTQPNRINEINSGRFEDNESPYIKS